MVIILEMNYNLTLYSGVTRVGRLHVSNIPPPRLSLPDVGSTSIVGNTSAVVTSSRPTSALEVRFEEEVSQNENTVNQK